MARIAPQSSIYCLRSLSRYSNTRVRDLSVWTMSWRVTENRKMVILLSRNVAEWGRGVKTLSLSWTVIVFKGGIWSKHHRRPLEWKCVPRLCSKLVQICSLFNVWFKASDFDWRDMILNFCLHTYDCWFDQYEISAVEPLKCSRNDLQFRHYYYWVWTPRTWCE